MHEYDVPTTHAFQDPVYVRGWADEAIHKNPERPAIFDAFVEAVNARGTDLTVAEIGSGPGFLAEQILDRCDVECYVLVDFSQAMHALARERIARHLDRARFVLTDVREPGWAAALRPDPDIALSMQALHELRHKNRAPRFYAQLRARLRPGGAVLVCDHLRPADDDRPLFMTVDEHLAALGAGGFDDPELLRQEGSLALFAAFRR